MCIEKKLGKYKCKSEKLTMKEQMDNMNAMLNLTTSKSKAKNSKAETDKSSNSSVKTPPLPTKTSQDDNINTLLLKIKQYGHLKIAETKKWIHTSQYLYYLSNHNQLQL